MPILSTILPAVRPRIEAPRYASWQDAMKDAVRDPDELLRLLGLSAEAGPTACRSDRANRQFPLFVPRDYIARMRPGDPHDPLLRQVLPIGEETVEVPGFVVDPVRDSEAAKRPGLLQKYRGRVLLITTGACAIHCRYCFRRHYPYESSPRRRADWEPALVDIAADETIHEVILSGGDPLTIVDDTLGELMDRLATIRQLRRLRIHTRLPIVIPARVTDRLVATLRSTRLAPFMVLHANHANELDVQVAASLAKLAEAGIVLLNQSVLLRGVNDTVEAQIALCERLVDLRVVPYYLHQLDRVAGAAHFEVPIALGRQIVHEMRSRLPGFAVPRYVTEAAGEAHKIILE